MKEYTTQVCVVAAGPSGLAAAVQAAEDGAEVSDSEDTEEAADAETTDETAEDTEAAE